MRAHAQERMQTRRHAHTHARTQIFRLTRLFTLGESYGQRESAEVSA